MRRRLHHQGALGGECARKSPVDRAELGLTSSQLTDGTGIPLVTGPTPANVRDHTLLPAALDRFTALEQALGPLPEHPHPALAAGHGHGHGHRIVHNDPAGRRIDARTAPRGAKTPIQTGGRWVVECTCSWMNHFGKLRRCTERRRRAVEFFLALAGLRLAGVFPWSSR